MIHVINVDHCLAALFQKIIISQGLSLVKSQQHISLYLLNQGTGVIPCLVMADNGTSPLGHSVNLAAYNIDTLQKSNMTQNLARKKNTLAADAGNNVLHDHFSSFTGTMAPLG